MGTCANEYNNIESVTSAPTWILFYHAKCSVRIELYIESYDPDQQGFQSVNLSTLERGWLLAV